MSTIGWGVLVVVGMVIVIPFAAYMTVRMATAGFYAARKEYVKDIVELRR